MTPTRWEKIDALFHEALALSPDQRPAFLDDACGADSSLRDEVESLLAADAEDLPLFQAAHDDLLTLLPAAETGEAPVIGNYEIERELGRGGMGAVYLARRADGQFEQEVALKVVKRGMDTDDILRRFRHERQILAALHHPHIAPLHDGGVTDDGRPFLAMEYVDGQSIDRYCDNQRLSVDARLQLFQTVCEAVQYAHQNLIVHRDLKPSNILVTNDGTVKLLDFGIAKLLDDRMALSGPLTHTGVRVMTPGYAAPEQVSGSVITTATDVYALGVVLYELLTGRRPADDTDAPERPSTAVTHAATTTTNGTTETKPPEIISAARATTTERLHRRLRGDLDTIVLKALRPEPERRYASADAFLDDIKRHLAGLPVTARPDTFGYRASKFIGRHRAAVLAAAVIFLLTVGFAATMAVQRNTIARERDSAEAMATYLEGVFGTSDPMLPQPERRDTMPVRTLLARSATDVRHTLSNTPVLQARMLNVLGRVHLNLGLYPAADSLLREALALRLEHLGADHPGVAETLHNLGQVKWRLRQPHVADSLFARAKTIRMAQHGSHHPEVALLQNLRGVVHLDLGDYETAERMVRAGYEVLRETPGPTDHNTLKSQQNLGLILQRQGRYDEAEPVLREALAHAQEEEHEVLRALILGNLSVVRMEQGAREEAVTFGREAATISTVRLGVHHPHTLTSKEALGLAMARFGAFDEAEAELRGVLEARQEMLGPQHPDVGNAYNLLGVTLTEGGAWSRAEPLFRESAALFQEGLGDTHPYVGISLVNLGRTRVALGAPEEAETNLNEALHIFEQRLGADHLYVSYPLVGLGWAALEKKEPEAAEMHLRKALALRLEAFAPDHTEVAEVKTLLGAALTAQGRYAEAEPLLLHSFEIGHDATDRNLQRFVHTHLAAYYRAQNQPDQAARYEALWAEKQATTAAEESR